MGVIIGARKMMFSLKTSITLLVAFLVSGSSSKRGIGLVPDNWSDPSNPSFLCGDMAALGRVTWWYDWGIADIHGWSGPAYSCPGGRGPPGFVPILRKHEYTSADALPDIEVEIGPLKRQQEFLN